jgi:hypothetical protein
MNNQCLPKQLENIRPIEYGMYVHSTGRISYTDLMGDRLGYGTLGIANILSLSQMIGKGYIVTFASNMGDTLMSSKKTVVHGYFRV